MARAMRDAAAQALRAEVEATLAEATTRVPVDTGELRDSGVIVGEGMSLSIAYTARHALPVHERVEVRHLIGEAKWLERTMDERSGGMAARMGSDVRQRVSG
jgi:hypothetical protein